MARKIFIIFIALIVCASVYGHKDDEDDDRRGYNQNKHNIGKHGSLEHPNLGGDPHRGGGGHHKNSVGDEYHDRGEHKGCDKHQGHGHRGNGYENDHDDDDNVRSHERDYNERRRRHNDGHGRKH